jgi:hypothetical protein
MQALVLKSTVYASAAGLPSSLSVSVSVVQAVVAAWALRGVARNWDGRARRFAWESVRRTAVALVALTAASAWLAYVVYTHSLGRWGTSYYVGGATYGDMPFHLGVITSFAWGANRCVGFSTLQSRRTDVPRAAAQRNPSALLLCGVCASSAVPALPRVHVCVCVCVFVCLPPPMHAVSGRHCWTSSRASRPRSLPAAELCTRTCLTSMLPPWWELVRSSSQWTPPPPFSLALVYVRVCVGCAGCAWGVDHTAACPSAHVTHLL